MNKITFCVVYLVCVCLYSQTGWDIPTPGLRLLTIGTTIWAICVVYAHICRRHPLFGWFLLGLFQGMVGGRRGRW